MKSRPTFSLLCVLLLVVVTFVSTSCAKTRVVTKAQCYYFIAEEQPDKCGNKYSTWEIQWEEPQNNEDIEKCNIRKVAVAQHPSEPVPCGQQVGFSDVSSQPLSIITVTNNKMSEQNEQSIGSPRELEHALVANTTCSEVWLRFIETEGERKGCNVRCYMSGGRAYCY